MNVYLKGKFDGVATTLKAKEAELVGSRLQTFPKINEENTHKNSWTTNGSILR